MTPNTMERHSEEAPYLATNAGDVASFLAEVEDLTEETPAAEPSRMPPPGKGWGNVELLDPRKPGESLSFEELASTSIGLEVLYGADKIDPQAIGPVKAMAAAQGEILARAAEAAGNTPEPGERVVLTREGEYRAERYGYVCLVDGAVSVRSPVWMDDNHMHAYWLVLDPEPHPVREEMIRQWLDDLGIVVGIRADKIADLVTSIRSGSHKRGLYLIAVGQEPRHGEDAQVEVLVDTQRRAGKVRADGSVDFREVNFTPTAGPGQLIAWRTPATQGTAGLDVRGNALPAEDGENRELRAGGNVEVKQSADKEEYYSKIAGMLRLAENVLTVAELLSIGGDVDFHTGNLKFSGEVYVSGSIARGFSVKAGADVTVGGALEPGATVSTRGDIAVGQGIVGRKTRVFAGGSVSAQHAQEATITAGKDISLGSYAYHANLRAGGKVVIARSQGDRGGSIMGGKTWGRQGIETHTAGTLHGMASVLVAGLSPAQAKELDRIHTSITVSNTQMERILNRFEMQTIDLTQIKNLIKAATGPARKVLARRAHQLGQVVQSHQQLLARQKEMREQLGAGRKTEIKVWDRAFPGVTVRLREHQRELVEELEAPRFRIVEEKLVAK